MTDSAQVRYRGAILDPQELLERDTFRHGGDGVLAVGLDDEPLAAAFDSEAEVVEFAAARPSGPKVTRMLEHVQRLRADRNVDQARITRSLDDERRRVEPLLTKLARELGRPFPSREVFAEAERRRILHTLILADGKDLTGEWRIIGGPIDPLALNLGWTGFDNRATSFLVFGIGGLWDLPWFGGRSLLIGGIPGWQNNLAVWGWDNIASSCYVTGP